MSTTLLQMCFFGFFAEIVCIHEKIDIKLADLVFGLLRRRALDYDVVYDAKWTATETFHSGKVS